MLSIVNWNIDENYIWYVRLSDTGTGVAVALYTTQADAEAETNMQAGGESDGYGEALEVSLINETSAARPVSRFQQDYLWHLVIAGSSGDEDRIFKVKEFVDMDEIAHPIYRNSALIEARAAAEINAHTHAKIKRRLTLGVHLPELEAGGIVRLNSARRGANDLAQVFELRITGTQGSLVSELEAVKFMGLKR